MKIFICTDAEGISCLDKKELISEDTLLMRTRLMADVNAAIRGAFDGGADIAEKGPCLGAGGQIAADHDYRCAVSARPGGHLQHFAAAPAVQVVIVPGEAALRVIVKGI